MDSVSSIDKSTPKTEIQVPQEEQSVKTRMGLTACKIKAKNFIRMTKANYNNRMTTLKHRATKTMANIKSFMKNALDTARLAGRRALIGGSAGAFIGGVTTATAIAIGVSNPLIGIPMALGFGALAANVGLLTGAGVGATLPITKEACIRLAGFNVCQYKKRIAELEQQLKAQQSIMETILKDPKVKIS